MGRIDQETVGFIDVGTNSIHLLVTRFYPGAAGTPVFADKETVRLGKSVFSTGSVDKETTAKCATVVSRFAEAARDLGAGKIVAYATCAAREASNREEFIKAISKEVDVEAIPGTEEARLIGLGVFGNNGPEERTVAIDIGGGSTEVIVAEDGENVFLDSLCLGAVRLAYSLGVDCMRPVSDPDYDSMKLNAVTSSYHATSVVRKTGFAKAVGSSGTFIALASMCASMRGDGDASYLTLKDLRTLMTRVRAMPAEDRCAYAGLNRSRADIIVPGGAIAESLMTLFGIERMEISDRGLKQGMEADHQLSRGYAMFGTKDASVKALACRCQYDQAHAEAVCSNALQLFDQSKLAGLHGMGGQMRNLLASSAILHDIGEFVNYTNHHILSQTIIENSDMVGFTCSELRYMGLIVRFHHKKFPGSNDSRFSGMSSDDVRDIRQCAMFLRIGDILDRHRTSAIKGVKLMCRRNEVVLTLKSDDDTSMETWRLEKLAPDFLRLFGYRLVVETAGQSVPDV